MTRREKAGKMVARANRHRQHGRINEAITCNRDATILDPTWSVPFYNLGLLYKFERNWEASVDWNRRATTLDPKDQAAWWNLGIAATALGRWVVARAAWRGFGIKVPAGDGPIDLPCGFCPIRLHPDGNAEVVWADRIDPARAVLASIPFPESNYRWRDIVLNDGAPTGFRQYKGAKVPVFDALQLLEAGPFGTYVARVALPPEDEYMEKLAETATKLEGSAEDWSTSTRLLCKACSEGIVHATHDTKAAPPEGMHLIGIAARSRDHAAQILSAWESDVAAKDVAAIHVESLEDALEPGTRK
jgi:hypothetical protein